MAIGNQYVPSIQADALASPTQRISVIKERPDYEALKSLAGRSGSSLAWAAEIWTTRIGRLLAQRPTWNGPIHYMSFKNEGNEVVGMFPFGFQRRGPLTVVSLAGFYYPIRSVAVCARSVENVASMLAEELAGISGRTGLRFGPVIMEDPFNKELFIQLRARGWIVHPLEASTRMCVRLTQDVNEFLAGLSKKRVKQIRRSERKFLREREDAEIREYTRENCDDWFAVIDDMRSVEQASWLPDEGGDLHFESELNRKLWFELLGAPLSSIKPRIWIAYDNGKPVAFNLSLMTGEVCSVVIGHYDKEYRKHGLGHVLDLRQLTAAIADGATIADFGNGDSGYKQTVWKAQPARRMCDFLAFPPGVTGRLITSVLRLKQAIPATRDKLTAFGRQVGMLT